MSDASAIGAEAEVLDKLDQEQVICSTCGATLIEYRQAEKCSADLVVACEGFCWVERALGRQPN